MKVLRETALLGSETITIWLRTATRMIFWCALGSTAKMLGMFTSAWIGASQQTLAVLVFLAGEVALIAAFVMMLHSAHNELQSPRQLRQHRTPNVPPTVFRSGTATETLVTAVGPFLVVYATWGFVEDELRTLFSTNLVLHGINVEQWSIGFDRWRFFLLLALAIFIVKQILERLGERYFPNSRITLVVLMMCEAGWIFATFVGLNHVFTTALNWLYSRTFWVALTNGWERFLATVPPLNLPGIGSLPQALDDFVQWIGQSFIPGAWQWAVLPMFWLALTAVVHGWRDFSVRAVLQGRTADTLAWTERGVVAVISKDLREKYLPVLSCVRLIVHAGPFFIAAYLMLSAVLNLAHEWLPWLFQAILNIDERSWYFAVNYPIGAVADIIAYPLIFSLYLAAFDRAIADTTGMDWSARRMARALQTGNVTATQVLGGAPAQRRPRRQAES